MPVTATEPDAPAPASIAEPADDTTVAVPEAEAGAKTEEKLTTQGKLLRLLSESPENLADGHRT